ncbi:xanthomonadin biosynthesis protein [Xanthomonas campestris]|nr:xanthomonadin biosynthesis protein [Xanthomonas campestris]
MVQPCSLALPPGPSVPQLVGWSLLSDAAARDTTEANCNERSAGTTCQGELPNLPQPATAMTAVRSQPHACLRTHRSGNHKHLLHHGLRTCSRSSE